MMMLKYFLSSPHHHQNQQKFFFTTTTKTAFFLLLLLFLLVIGIIEAKAKTSYYADFGEYGFMSLEIDNDDDMMNYNIELVNVRDFFQSNEAGYHFHSGLIGNGQEYYGAGNTASDLCGPNNTLGHYDPTLKCGSASSAPLCFDVTTTTEDCCIGKPLDGYCSTGLLEETCEIGDLSGRFGKLNINNDGTASTSVVDVACPNCNDDYLLLNSNQGITANYKTWASIVFHDSIDGSSPRVLCGNLVIVSDDKEDENNKNDSSSASSSASTTTTTRKSLPSSVLIMSSIFFGGTTSFLLFLVNNNNNTW